MGNGCTKNIRKSSVAPDDAGKSSTKIVPSFIEPIKINVAQSATTKPSIVAECVPSTSGDRRSPQNKSIFQTSNYFDKNNSRDTNGSSNLYIDNPEVTSIMFDKVEPSPPTLPQLNGQPHFGRSISIDGRCDKSAKNSDAKQRRFSTSLHKIFKSNQNLATVIQPVNKSESASKFYHRFSSSMQSLFNSNLNANRRRNLSASDTSLNKRSAMTQQQLIDNNYCPSVIFSRRARKSSNPKTSDKTQTFSRWNQLFQMFSRKKTPKEARKS